MFTVTIHRVRNWNTSITSNRKMLRIREKCGQRMEKYGQMMAGVSLYKHDGKLHQKEKCENTKWKQPTCSPEASLVKMKAPD